jgi:ribosomal protein L11 methyltransferase
MFCAYNWFEKPELYAAIRAASLEWAGAGERVIFMETGLENNHPAPQKRSLTANELSTVKNQLDAAWQATDFGGFISEAGLSGLKGLCHFKLNQEKTTARLDCLLLDLALSELSPLQNPALHLALLALLAEAPGLKTIFLPFGEFSEPDQAALKMFGLAPTDEAGWWLTKQSFLRKTDFITFGLDLTTPVWLELKIQVPPALYKLVWRLFSRFGFRNKTTLHVPFKAGPLGEELEDSTAPVTVLTYLPKNERHSQNLAELQEALGHLSKISPLPGLEQREVSQAEARPFEIKSNYNSHTYKIGRRLIVQIIKEDQATNDVQVELGELVIKLNQTAKAFGPQPGYIHPATQMILELMETWFDPAQHLKVLDLGTGTGALALAAARLGIKYVLAIDPNREAVGIARENVLLNGLEDKIVTEAGSLGLTDVLGGGYTFRDDLQQRPASLDGALPFDAILANIFTSNLINLSEAIGRSIRPGGLLMSSGIPVKDIPTIAAIYKAIGLEQLEQRELFGWVAFVHKKV